MARYVFTDGTDALVLSTKGWFKAIISNAGATSDSVTFHDSATDDNEIMVLTFPGTTDTSGAPFELSVPVYVETGLFVEHSDLNMKVTVLIE